MEPFNKQIKTAISQVNQEPKNHIRLLGTEENLTHYKWLIHSIANGILGPGQKYEFTENNKPVFDKLLNYFTGRTGDIDLNKGIALIGNFGAGKSTIFEIFHRFLRTAFPFNQNLFRITSIEEIISDMKAYDFMGSKMLYNHQEGCGGEIIFRPIHVLINEFGHKYEAKSYGTDVNELVDMFLMKRYDIYQTYGKLVHITSNCDIDDLRKQFDERIIDRFREMFNFIELKGTSFRK